MCQGGVPRGLPEVQNRSIKGMDRLRELKKLIKESKQKFRS
jgi:hypothetical protein